MRKFIFILSVFLAGLFYSCEQNHNLQTLSIDKSYFPLDTGSWIIYNVKLIVIDSAIGKYDTIFSQLKELVESTFIDNEGNTSYRIERFVRENEQKKWLISDVWYATIYPNSVQEIEENIRYVKMIFPVEVNNTWNGNLYNINSETSDIYRFDVVDESLNLNDLTFDSVATIIQKDNESLIDKAFISETYAKNIGLIEKTNINIYSENNNFNLNILDRITFGTIYKQEIVEYEKN